MLAHALSHAHGEAMTIDNAALCVWASGRRYVSNRIRLHHQIDQAFPIFLVRTLKNMGRPANELTAITVYYCWHTVSDM